MFKNIFDYNPTTSFTWMKVLDSKKTWIQNFQNKAYHLNLMGSLAPLTQTTPTLSYFVNYIGKDIECSPKGILHFVKKLLEYVNME
jgi:hypothetical protein